MPTPPSDHYPDTFVKKQFDTFLENHGRWIIYIRADDRFKCPLCYDPLTNSSANGNCPRCLGTGSKITLEKCKVNISFDTTKTYQSSSGISPAYMGELESFGAILYSPSYLYPKPFDLLVEVEWTVPYQTVNNYGTPTKVLRAWRLKGTLPVISGQYGQVDLYLSGMEQHGLESAYIEHFIRSAGSSITSPYHNDQRSYFTTSDFVSDSKNVISSLGRASRNFPFRV